MKLSALVITLTLYSPLLLLGQRLVPPRNYHSDDDDDDDDDVRQAISHTEEDLDGNATGKQIKSSFAVVGEILARLRVRRGQHPDSIGNRLKCYF
jgi:hypothetical protein